MTAPRFVALPLAVAALALAGPAVVTPTSVQGSSFTVDSPFDDVDVSPGDGLCGTSTGVCTLRAAVQEANALPGPDAVSLPEGTYELRIKGSTGDAASGDLDIAEDLAISGAGADTTVIDGGFVAFGTSLDDH